MNGFVFPEESRRPPVEAMPDPLAELPTRSAGIDPELGKRDASTPDAVGQQRRWLEAALAAIVDFHYVLDLDGRFCHVDTAFAESLQRRVADLIGKNFCDLDYPAEQAAALQQQVAQVIRSRQPASQEIMFVTPGGQSGYREYVFAPVLAADGTVEAVTGIARDVTRYRHATAALQQAHATLENQIRQRTAELLEANQLLQVEIGQRRLAAQLLFESQQLLRHLAAHQERVKEDERKRIAREIHDELGQSLLALRIDVSRLQARTGNTHSGLNQRAGAALKQLDLTIQSVRDIINNLRPAVLDLGLRAAIEWQIKDFQRHSGIACELLGDGDVDVDAALDDERAIDLFRIVQEALANILRHAQASRAAIELRCADGVLAMRISDDGIGMDATAARKSGSFGLVGMRERIHYLQGQLKIDSVPGQGATLRISIPLSGGGKPPEPGAP